MDAEQVNQWIRNRSSIFPDQFDPDNKIDDDIIMNILTNATWAPTHKLTEPWQFLVYGPERVSDFFDALKEVYLKDRSESDISRVKLNKYEKRKRQVSHVIVVNMIRDSKERVPELEEICAVSCAIQNIYLSLAPHNVGGYLSTGLVFNPAFGDYLKLGAKDKCLGYFFLGNIKSDYNSPERKRINLKDKLIYIQ